MQVSDHIVGMVNIQYKPATQASPELAMDKRAKTIHLDEMQVTGGISRGYISQSFLQYYSKQEIRKRPTECSCLQSILIHYKINRN
jgi:hypothetical protein